MADTEITYRRERFDNHIRYGLKSSLGISDTELDIMEKGAEDDYILVYAIYNNDEKVGFAIYKIDKLADRQDFVVIYQVGIKHSFIKYNKILAFSLAEFYNCTHVRLHISEEDKGLQKMAESEGFKKIEEVYLHEVLNGRKK